MGKYLGPKCKLCRRERTKLFLKGELCHSPKCPLNKRKYPPGIHGMRRGGRLSEYGIQLREKQKAKRSYNLSETQFKNYYKKATKQKGNSGENLLILLEMRLDNVVYKLGFAPSRDAARQIVNHGHIMINGRKINIPSYQVKPKDIVKIKEKSSLLSTIRERMSSKIKTTETPSWLSLDAKKMEAQVLNQPDPKDLPQDLDTKIIVEFYSR